ncbi:MAG: type II toxin-antitoxin system VapC family toxin [Thermomicrobiales bacterium]|nr:type II toxin-antitoxin system VapC family toxin [Thermomicrobiales bacterium]
MPRYLLDTDAVIDFFKGVASTVELVDRLYRQDDALCTCGVVIAEVYTGLSPRERAEAELFLASMRFLSTSLATARQAGLWRYEFARRGRQLSATDCLIAATAREHRAMLITGNTSHYPMPGVTVLPLPRLQNGKR